MRVAEKPHTEASAQLDEYGNFFEAWKKFERFKTAQKEKQPKEVVNELRTTALGLAGRLQTLQRLQTSLALRPDLGEYYGHGTRIERRLGPKIKNHWFRKPKPAFIVGSPNVVAQQNTLNLRLDKSDVSPQDYAARGKYAKVDLLSPGVRFTITDPEFLVGKKAIEEGVKGATFILRHAQFVEGVALDNAAEQEYHHYDQVGRNSDNIQLRVDDVDMHHDGRAVALGEVFHNGHPQEGSVAVFLAGLNLSDRVSDNYQVL